MRMRFCSVSGSILTVQAAAEQELVRTRMTVGEFRQGDSIYGPYGGQHGAFEQLRSFRRIGAQSDFWEQEMGA